MAGPGGVIWLEKLRPRNPLQEGVPSPSFRSWGDRGAGQGAPHKAPSYQKAALGSCLSCPICRPHTLSGLCHGVSLCLARARGHGQGCMGA